SDTLHESNIYPFILYYQKQLIAIGYIDENHDMDFLYLHSDTLHESNIYPFILYYQKQLIAIGYIDENHDM
ncbi:SAUGI family uracil-DNA glycosylase inhibitor, partial [Staphylococcus aureus]